jgi:hypothetical protein
LILQKALLHDNPKLHSVVPACFVVLKFNSFDKIHVCFVFYAANKGPSHQTMFYCQLASLFQTNQMLQINIVTNCIFSINGFQRREVLSIFKIKADNTRNKLFGMSSSWLILWFLMDSLKKLMLNLMVFYQITSEN